MGTADFTRISQGAGAEGPGRRKATRFMSPDGKSAILVYGKVEPRRFVSSTTPQPYTYGREGDWIPVTEEGAKAMVQRSQTVPGVLTEQGQWLGEFIADS